MTSKNQVFDEAEKPIAVEASDGMLRVSLQDGRMIATPLAWYPRLHEATAQQLAHVEIGVSGIHWPDLDEDLSVAGMLRGIRPPEPKQKKSL